MSYVIRTTIYPTDSNGNVLTMNGVEYDFDGKRLVENGSKDNSCGKPLTHDEAHDLLNSVSEAARSIAEKEFTGETTVAVEAVRVDDFVWGRTGYVSRIDIDTASEEVCNNMCPHDKSTDDDCRKCPANDFYWRLMEYEMPEPEHDIRVTFDY